MILGGAEVRLPFVIKAEANSGFSACNVSQKDSEFHGDDAGDKYGHKKPNQFKEVFIHLEII